MNKGNHAMFQTYTVAEMREVERLSVVHGITLTQLMDNAGHSLARCAVEIKRAVEIKLGVEISTAASIAVICGTGNNGGDGYVCAAALQRQGLDTRVWGIGRERLTGDSLAGAAAKAYEEAGGIIQSLTENTKTLGFYGLVIDSVFGTGLNRPVSGIYAHAIRLIRQTGARVLSCDVPSGVDADTGRVMGDAVRADVTLMLGLAKPACYLPPGCDYFGDVRLADIGIPKEAVSGLGKYEAEEPSPCFAFPCF